jgi:Transposase DDE domain
MPEPLWISLLAVLYLTNFTTCAAISDAFASASPDQLPRLLQGTWSGHTLLNLALRLLFTVAGGYLILDDTGGEKPSARLLSDAAWVWSSKQRKVVCGGSVVLLVWTDGPRRIPLALRLWPQGGPAKCTLALALLRYARNRLRCKPQFVLFDAWYPSQTLLKRLRDSGGDLVCQLKKNRRFAGKPLVRSLSQPEWQATGHRAGGLKVFVVRYRRKYDATNRLRLSAKEVRTLYRKRQEVEEGSRVWKSHRRLEGCQAGSRRSSEAKPLPREGAQAHHVALGLVAYLIVERERLDCGAPGRQRQRQRILQGPQSVLPALERVRRAA